MQKEVVGDLLGRVAQSAFMGSLPTVMAATADIATAGAFVGPKVCSCLGLICQVLKFDLMQRSGPHGESQR